MIHLSFFIFRLHNFFFSRTLFQTLQLLAYARHKLIFFFICCCCLFIKRINKCSLLSTNDIYVICILRLCVYVYICLMFSMRVFVRYAIASIEKVVLFILSLFITLLFFFVVLKNKHFLWNIQITKKKKNCMG